MKISSFFPILPFLLLTQAVFGVDKGKEGYEIKARIQGLKDTVCYFGYHLGDKQYVSDTVRIDSKGNMVFRGDKKLEGGIYLIVPPNKKFLEVLITDEQHFSFETDTVDILKNMKFKGSPENELFYQYLNQITIKQKQIEPLRKRYDQIKESKKDSAEVLKEKINAIDKEVKEYKSQLAKDHPDKLLSKILKATFEPEVPEAPILANGRKDSTFAYRYFKAHFWDQVDLTDGRLIRTPVLLPKVNYYMEKLTYQIPDSVLVSARLIIEKSKASKEMFKYLVVTLTSNYEISKIMGMDAVFVGLVEDYYKTGQAYWADSLLTFKITDRARVMKPLLLGKRTPNLILADTSGVMQNLWNVNAKYTVLCFWDPDCSHCKKVVPKLKEWYSANKSKGVEVFGVCTETEEQKWKKFIRDNNLDWINVADIQLHNHFRSVYDISSTPVIYMLDKNKVIFAKKMGVEQMSEILDNQIKKEKKESQARP
jgi:peroxiredoxin